MYNAGEKSYAKNVYWWQFGFRALGGLRDVINSTGFITQAFNIKHCYESDDAYSNIKIIVDDLKKPIERKYGPQEKAGPGYVTGCEKGG